MMVGFDSVLGQLKFIEMMMIVLSYIAQSAVSIGKLSLIIRARHKPCRELLKMHDELHSPISVKCLLTRDQLSSS